MMETLAAFEELKIQELKKMIARGAEELEAGDFVDGESFMRELMAGI